MSNLFETTRFRGSTLSPKVSETAKQREYKSRIGIGFPFKKDSTYVSKAVEVELAKSNLRQLLNTIPGERVMLPEFGCSLNSLLFEPFDEDLVVKVRDRVTESISQSIPYLKITRLRVYRADETQGFGLPTLVIKLSCQIREDENAIFEVDVKL